MNIIINNKAYEIEEGLTILQACRKIHIAIPTLCHDERLEPESSCRLCVVEVGDGKLMTACSTLCSEGMKIETESERVVQARREVLDLLFSNHPNDCLTCQKSGECQLQDYCYEYGVAEGSYRSQDNKHYDVDDSNDFYFYDPNKCILCGKCVRMCSELQVSNAIGMENRGFDTKVSTPFDLGLDQSKCVSCGNCVAVCPTGALMPKTRKKFRLWEIEKTKTTCAYCAVGCQLELLTKDGEVVGARPFMMQEPNQGMLCVKGRFATHFINHPDRLKNPMIRKDGKLVDATWAEATDLIASKFSEIKSRYGSDAIGGFSCARSTNEDNYMFQKFMRAVIGTNNVDHCARV